MPLRERRARARAVTRDERRVDLMLMSQAALLDHTQGLWWAADDPDWDDDQRAYGRLAHRHELKLAQDEVHRRQRMVNGGRVPPAQFGENGARLTRLCRAIHEQVHLGHVMEDAGMALVRRGQEFHSECPICGGVDRFVIWPPPRSRGWCRMCGWHPDVIAFWRWNDHSGFAGAVHAIARRYLGMGLEVDR
jgi:hypothetical protein